MGVKTTSHRKTRLTHGSFMESETGHLHDVMDDIDKIALGYARTTEWFPRVSESLSSLNHSSHMALWTVCPQACSFPFRG